MLTDQELVLHGLFAAGGVAGAVNLEDVALTCWNLYPETFSWTGVRRFPNKEAVHAALMEARSAGVGLVSGTVDAANIRTGETAVPDRWILTDRGLEWVTANLERLRGRQSARAVGSARSKRERVLWWALASGCVLSLMLSYSIARLWLTVGSPQGHAIYQYVKYFDVSALGVAIVASLAAGALLYVPDSLLRRREWWVVGVWIVAAIGLQGVLRSVTPFTFEGIFASDGANSFYSVARQHGPAAMLRDFESLRSSWPLHAQSNMPGKLLLVYALERVTMDPGVLAWLVVALSNLGGVLLYLIVRAWFADRVVALFALVLYLFVPAKLYFFPLLNTVTPVIVLGCLWLLVRWVDRQRPFEAALFGASLYGLVLFEPLALVTGLVFAAVLGRALWQGTLTARTFWRQGSVAAGGFAAVYALMWLAFGFDLISTLGHVTVGAIGFNSRFDRPYGIWMRQNPLDFLFGVGLCQALLFWVALGDGLRGSAPWRERLMRPIVLLTLALAGTFVALDLIGVNRGEVIRLWIFLACLFQIPAAYACARLHSRTAMALLLGTTMVQNAVGTLMIGFIVT